MSLTEKLKWTIPWYGAISWVGTSLSDPDFDSKIGKIASNIIYSGLLSIRLVVGYGNTIGEKKAIQRACETLSYEQIENVKRVENIDLNHDGAGDYILHLKNKSKLEFLSKIEYKQRK